LAELLKFEGFDDTFMIEACTTFVAEFASTVVQRVYRGHIGRRKFKVLKDIKWAKEAEQTAIIMQAAYRFVHAWCSNRRLSLCIDCSVLLSALKFLVLGEIRCVACQHGVLFV